MLEQPRVLLVHAHPDDEVTTTAITMAKAIAQGAHVTLVTCTLGEEGEVVAPELSHLAGTGPELGKHRIQELNAAMAVLGVSDLLRLGGDGKYRDSGMTYDEAGRAIPTDTLHDDCFWRADLRDAADDLVPILRERRPHVLITYDTVGGYGHPDHVMAHRVAMYASQLAGVPSYLPEAGAPWTVSRILWTTMSETWLREGIRRLRASGQTEGFAAIDPDGPLPISVAADADIAVTVREPGLVAKKLDAFRAHASQIALDSPFFSMADQLGDFAWAAEWFRIAQGTPLPGGACDIFEGL